MIIRYTTGSDPDFESLCRLLDDDLNDAVGGEKQRTQYMQYNLLHDIKDVMVAYDSEIPIGCASFKQYDAHTAEIKRVFVRKEYRGKGLSKELMRLIEEKAFSCGYKKLILETGKPLTAAMALYLSIGYIVTANYGPYKNMPGSVCMEKHI